MKGNNPNQDLVNMNAHTKFGEILSISSKDIEWKRNSDINQRARIEAYFSLYTPLLPLNRLSKFMNSIPLMTNLFLIKCLILFISEFISKSI